MMVPLIGAIVNSVAATAPPSGGGSRVRGRCASPSETGRSSPTEVRDAIHRAMPTAGGRKVEAACGCAGHDAVAHEVFTSSDRHRRSGAWHVQPAADTQSLLAVGGGAKGAGHSHCPRPLEITTANHA